MSPSPLVRRCLLLCFSLAAAGCIGSPSIDEEASADDEDAVGTELSGKASGITVWANPVARPIVRYGANGWLVEGRTSKNLNSVFSFSSDDEFGEATLLSPRKFEIFVDEMAMERLTRGYRLFLDIKPASGSHPQYFAAFELAPRLTRFTGSSKIYPLAVVEPFVFGDEVRYRETVSLAKGYGGLAISTPAGLVPTAIREDRFADFQVGAMLEVAHDPGASFLMTAHKGTTEVEKRAGADLVITSVGVTTNNAFDEWPEPSCQPAVLACLQALPEGELDRSSCGDAIDVLPCAYLL